MPIIKARSSSIISSVDLRGQPTAATAAAGTNTTQIASTGYVRQAVADLIASAPNVLDTLNELAAALGNDANFSTTITNALAGKVALAGSTMTGLLTLSGAPQNDLHAATKLYVDQAINAQMIYSTDDVDEGTTNLYFTQERARASVSLTSDNPSVITYNQATGAFTYVHPNSDGILEGTTNKYYTTARVRNDIGLTSDDNQILSYGSSTGQFTFTTPNTDKITEGAINQYFTTARARNSISNGSNINYDPATGVVSTQAAVWSVNTQTGDVVLDTDNVDEGTTNLYFSDARAAGAITLTTNDSSILSYASGAFTFVKPDTDKVAEGSNNQYFTTARARESISATGWNVLSYNDQTGVINITAPTTTNVTEGDNLYFTDTRARNAVSGSKVSGDGLFSYASATGVFSYTGPDDADYRQAVSANAASGDGDLAYDSATGVFTYTGPTNSDYRGAVSAVRASGDGNLAYDSATGVFTYTGPSAAETRAHFSATTSGTGHGGLTYDDATGVITFAKVTSADVRGEITATTSGSGHGGLTYDSATGVVTYAKVTSANVRGEISATTASGVTYTTATGVIALSAIPNASLTNSEVTVNGYAIALGGNKTLNADDIAEAVGGTNKYFTEARFDTSLAGKTTDDVAEGDNLYYTQGRFDTAFTAKSTTNLAEGTNLYFTTTRARNSVSGGTGVTYSASTGDISIGQAVGTTDSVTFANVTSPLTGDVTGNVSGNAGTATKFATARNINGVAFDGTANVIVHTAGTGVSINGTEVSIGQAVGTTDDVTFNNVVVDGDLTVNGTMTAVNSTTVTIADKNLTLASGAASAAVASGAGITVDGANANITYSSGTDSWDFNKDVNVTGGLTVTEDLTAPTFIGNLTGNVTGNVTGEVTGNSSTATALKTARNIQGVSFDGSANITVVTAGTGVTVTGTEVKIGQAVGIIDEVTFAKVTSPLTGDVTGNVSGNAGTATKLATARNIQGVSFDGSTAITVVTAGTGVTVTGTEVKIGQAVATTDSVTFAGVTSTFTGDLTGDVLGDVTGQVSSISNHNTDALSEGLTNLYATPERVRAALSAGTSGTGFGGLSFNSTTGAFTFAKVTSADVRGEVSAVKDSGDGNFSYSSSTGVFTYTGPTDADYRDAVSANKVSGDGNFSYDSATGVFSYTGPSATDARAHFSAVDAGGDGSFSYNQSTGAFTYTGPSASEVRAHINAVTAEGATYDSATGAIGLANVPNASLANSSITINGATIALGGSDTLNTDDIGEGTTNQYFLNSRARNAISLTTGDSSVLAYDPATGVFTFSLAGINSDEVQEGSVNLYFTTARARNSISNGSNINYDAATGVISTQAAVWSVNTQTGDVVLDTDNIDEGATNLYFTDSRAASAITLVTDDADILSYATGTGTFTFVTPDTDSIDEGAVNQYYTVERGEAVIAAASVFDLADVASDGVVNDGYSLVWNSALQTFIAQNIAVTVTTLNFTGDGTTTSFNTEVEINTINDVQVYINGLVQAPTYSFTINTVNDETSIVFDTAPEADDYIMVRATPTAQLSAGGILNENSTIDGGTY
jgi:hypothetical protein